MGGFAWVTLATNDSYSLGALVLGHSLKQAGTVHQLAVLVTPGVTGIMRQKLATVFNVVREVNILDSGDEANLRLLKRPELGVTFTKLHCWRLTQFEKCVFLDADTLVLANADELFDREEFSAAPDVGWPDCFNSGVFVYRPSEETYSKLVQFALDKGSFDGGDQGLLNLYFSDWAHKDISKHLPFIYNMCSTACYSYLPAFKQFGPTVKIIHFIGNTKPWLQYFDSETQHVQVVSDIQHLQVVVQQWWNIFCSCIHPILSPEMAGLAGAFARLTLGVPRTPEQTFLEDQLRKQGWEVGNIDYMGRDAFDNIWSKICETLNTRASPQSPAPPPPADPAPEVATKQADTEPTQEPQISEQKTVIEKMIEPVAAAPLSPVTTPTEPIPVSTVPLLETVPPLVQTTPVSPPQSVPEATPKQTTPTPTEKQTSSQPDPPKETPSTPVSPQLESVKQITPTSAPPGKQSSQQEPPPKPASPEKQISPQSEPPIQTAPTPVQPSAQLESPKQPTSVPSPIAPPDTPQTEPPKQTPEKQAIPTPVPSEKQATPKPVPPETQATPTPVPSEKQATPTPVPSEKQATPTPVPSEKQPAPAQPEPAKPQAKPQSPKSDSSKKQPETPKTTPPAPKSKKDSHPQAVAESTKPTVNVPKPAAEQTSGQKAAPQSPNAEGPTPPPRKGAGGQASAKKPGKGKK